MMLLSLEAAAYVRVTPGQPLFDLTGQTPTVAYVDGTGRVLCPRHRDHARGEVIAQDADNSAMDEERCDSCQLRIAAVMLAARTAQFAADCYPCRKAYLNHGGWPARPCPAHTTGPTVALAAIADDWRLGQG